MRGKDGVSVSQQRLGVIGSCLAAITRRLWQHQNVPQKDGVGYERQHEGRRGWCLAASASGIRWEIISIPVLL